MYYDEISRQTLGILLKKFFFVKKKYAVMNNFFLHSGRLCKLFTEKQKEINNIKHKISNQKISTLIQNESCVFAQFLKPFHWQKICLIDFLQKFKMKKFLEVGWKVFLLTFPRNLPLNQVIWTFVLTLSNIKRMKVCHHLFYKEYYSKAFENFPSTKNLLES